MLRASKRRAATGSFIVAAGGLLFAAYLYSYCIPLEAACHLGIEGACERLTTTLGASAKTALAAGCCLAVALLLRRSAKR